VEKMSEKDWIEIAGRRIGHGYPVYVVAEMSANHGQNYEQAARIVQAAKDAGADAIKLQTYTPDTLTARSSEGDFRIGGGTIWDGRTLYDLYEESYMPWEWQPKLKKIADDIGITLFSAAFDQTAVDFLEGMNVAVHKIASPEIIDLPLIEKMACTGKPLIISTGMADLSEIEEAVSLARRAGAVQIALLKCTSAYPAPPDEMNLRTIPHMSSAFNAPVGLSDHSMGIAVPVAAVSVGACLVEKHFTLSRSFPSVDSSFSLEPEEFRAMVDAVHVAEKSLGTVHYGITERERPGRKLRRSLYVVEDVKANEIFTHENLRSIRPGGGLHTRYLQKILGQRAARDISGGTALTWELVARQGSEAPGR
jgi:pseudaminic acid synthase